MLVSRLLKKFPSRDAETVALIDAEVVKFCASEYISKESMKQLEARINRQLYPNTAQVTERSPHNDLTEVYANDPATSGSAGNRL